MSASSPTLRSDAAAESELRHPLADDRQSIAALIGQSERIRVPVADLPNRVCGPGSRSPGIVPLGTPQSAPDAPPSGAVGRQAPASAPPAIIIHAKEIRGVGLCVRLVGRVVEQHVMPLSKKWERAFA